MVQRKSKNFTREVMKHLRFPSSLALLALLLAGCVLFQDIVRTPERPAQAPTHAPQATLPAGLTQAEFDTLNSLEQIAPFPLYTMQYYGDYETITAGGGAALAAQSPAPAWACSLFAALHDPESRLFGRNFDWEFSPALLLFTDPSDGYASVTMVDIAYLGFDGSLAHSVMELPMIEQKSLLAAPRLPFDGMNAAGLAVGMAAVPDGGMRPDPEKDIIGSLLVIREMLDHAANVDEAVKILETYNVDMQGGPPLHYLIADRAGRAALVEFYQGRIVIQPNENPWHQATNFIRASAGNDASGQCWRYDNLTTRLEETGGSLSPDNAMELLRNVAQPNTQWSVVYEMSTGAVSVVMGQRYGEVYAFNLPGFRE
jgi:choloylglycine hydrolase